MKNGIVSDPNVDYCIIENTDVEPPSVHEQMFGDSKVYWVKRHNVSQCFGGYSESIRLLNEPYKYRFFINSTMRGPMLPPYSLKTTHWTEYFTNKFSDSVAMVGASISMNPKIHIQSMMMAVDQRALKILRDKNVFLKDDIAVEKSVLISQHEIRGTQVVLEAGLNIDCMITTFQGRDWRDQKRAHEFDSHIKHDPWYIGAYYGFTLHPYETIFFKTNRKDILEKTPLDLLSYYINKQPSTTPTFEPPAIHTDHIQKTLPIEKPILQKLLQKPKKSINKTLLLSVLTGVFGLAFFIMLAVFYWKLAHI
jgi:hypothetical protein